MAKFVYRLQNILNIKNKIENQAKSAYAEAMGRLRKVQSELEVLIARKKALKMIIGDLQQEFCPR